jgi:hypothetical protein
MGRKISQKIPAISITESTTMKIINPVGNADDDTFA